MKKLLAVLAVAVLALSLLSVACGGKPTQTSTTPTSTTQAPAPTSTTQEPAPTTTTNEPAPTSTVPDHSDRDETMCFNDGCHVKPDDHAAYKNNMCAMCHNIGDAVPEDLGA